MIVRLAQSSPLLFCLVWGIFPLALNLEAREPVKIISNFETPDALKPWTPSEMMIQLTREPQAVTLGKQAAQLNFPISAGSPELQMANQQLIGDWSEFDTLKADFFNPSDNIVTLSMRFDDLETTKWFTAAYVERSLRPGKNTLEVRLANLKTSDGNRALDLTKIRSFRFFRSEPQESVVLFLDQVRLEKDRMTKVTVPGLRAFDFGSEQSPLWPGFTRVTAKTAYDATVGFGWMDKENFSEGSEDVPDALAGDWVGGSHNEPFAHTFRVHLTDGEYGMAFMARPPTPVRTYGVKAGEEKQYEKIITSLTAPTTANLFAGLNREYAPHQDAFAKYIEPEYPVRMGKAIVRQNHLDITFESCNAHFLVVWPVAAQAEAELWLKALAEARRKEFFGKHYFTQLPKQTNKLEAWPEADRERGYVAFTRPLHQSIYPNTVPAPEERCAGLHLQVPWYGSDTASFAIFPLEDLAGVQVSIGEVTWGMGLWTKEDVVLREVRYLEHQNPVGVFTPTPGFLTPVRAASDLPRGFCRQYVLIIRNPIRSYTPYRAEITIKADDRPVTTIPVIIDVLPIELPPPEKFTVSYYYSNPFTEDLNYRYALTKDHEGANAMLRRELLDLREHGCNSLSLSFPTATVKRTQEGKIETQFNFDALKEEFRALHETRFDVRHEFLVSPLGFVNNHLLRAGLKEFSPEFNDAYLDGLSQVNTWAKDRNLRLLFWLVDEPREQMIQDWNRNLADTLQYLQLARNNPHLRTTVSPMGDSGDGVDYMPMMPLMDVVQTHPWAGSKKTIASTKANPKQQLWLYNAGMSRLLFGFYPWAVGANGYWQWHYQWREHPYDIFNEGEGAVFPSPDGPLPTLAYERSREGINDYRYLAYLETLIKNAEEFGGDNQKKIAATAKATLETIRKQIPEWPANRLPTGNETGGKGATPVDDLLDAWRKEIIGYILKLRTRKDE